MIIKNYLNYVGSKDRYLAQILPFIEEGAKKTNGSLFVDLCCGSAVVGANGANLFKETRCYDNCEQLVALHKYIWAMPEDKIMNDLDEIIADYELSKTNKSGFLALRQEYNDRVGSTNKMALAPILYMLITHSFNYSMHFNKKGGFSVPFGTNKSSFNPSLRNKLSMWKKHIDTLKNEEHPIMFEHASVFGVVQHLVQDSEPNSFVVFVDPPYSASMSKHPYRTGISPWGEEEDRKLLDALDLIHASGNYFIFTNCVQNNGVLNRVLQEWIYKRKYIKTPVSVDYTNCSYQRSNRGKTEEVIITNFNLGE